MNNLTTIFPNLESDRLHYIEIGEAHKEDIFRIFGDKEVVEYYNLIPFKDPDESLKIIRWFAQRRKENLGIRWGIVEKGKDTIIGTIGYNSFTKNHRSTIGYDLQKEFWGKGIMKEALETVIRFGFEQLNVNRIEAEVMQGNERSEKALKKLHFQKEGVLRDWMFWNGKHYDMSMFALLKSDWEEKR